MKCSSCPHLKSIEAGEYDSAPWEETPCAKCRLYEDSSRFMIQFNEENPVPVSVLFFRQSDDRPVGSSPSLHRRIIHCIRPASVPSVFGQSISTLSPRRTPMIPRLFDDAVTHDTRVQKVSGTYVQFRISRFRAAYKPSLYYLYLYCKKCHKCHCPITTGLSSMTLSVTHRISTALCHHTTVTCHSTNFHSQAT